MITIKRILQAARETVGVDIVFLSQLLASERGFGSVDARRLDETIRETAREPAEETPCALSSGPLPPMIPDTGESVMARSMPVAQALRMGAFLDVPIRLSDGTVFGTLCCIARVPRPALTDRDVTVLRAFAARAAEDIEQELRAEQMMARKEDTIRGLLASEGPSTVYQPVFMLDDMRLAGAEALSRFSGGVDRSPDLWFEDAAEVGLQVELELAAIRNALAGFRAVWNTHRIQLGLNASAATILDERLWLALDGHPRDLIVIELTEHEEVCDYPALLTAVTRLREHGTKLAVDDVGAGYASMRHVLALRPDILKLDIGLTRSIDSDDLRLALISSLKSFADQFSCRVVAEGVETAEELTILRQLGLQAAQGFLLGRPDSIAALLAAPHAAIGGRERRGLGRIRTARR